MSYVTLELIIKTPKVSHYYADIKGSPKATTFIGAVAAWNEQPKVYILERTEVNILERPKVFQWNAWEW